MKYLLLLLFSSSTFGAELVCNQNEYWPTQGMWVNAATSAHIDVISESKVILRDLKLDYTIFEDIKPEEYIWSKGSQTVEEESNIINYNPRKYKNHMKFSINVNGIGNENGFGLVDLIIPTKELTAAKINSNFEAYVIMTWMDDHFGGTTKVYCKIQ